jgi:hypothetical protein
MTLHAMVHDDDKQRLATLKQALHQYSTPAAEELIQRVSKNYLRPRSTARREGVPPPLICRIRHLIPRRILARWKALGRHLHRRATPFQSHI